MQLQKPPDMKLDSRIPDSAAEDPEIPPKIKTLSTYALPEVMGNLAASQFQHFPQWSSLVKGVAKLVLLARKKNKQLHPAIELPSKELKYDRKTPSITKTKAKEHAQAIIVKNTEQEPLPDEIDCLKKKMILKWSLNDGMMNQRRTSS